MSKWIAAAIAVLVGLTTPAGAVEPDVARPIVQDADDMFVRPAYFDLRVETTRLGEHLQQLCSDPDAEGLERARAQFSTAVDAWSRAEIVRFGPVTESNRLERFLFWPDRRSIGLKQVQEVLATQDPSAVSVAALEQKSVALQGFGALEYALFGTGSDKLATGDAYRCAYAATVASTLQLRATDVEGGWMEFAGKWREPGPANLLYRSADESLVEVLNTLIHGLEMVRDVRISGFLGEDAKADKPRQAIFWRSHKTVDSIRRNLDSLHTLFVEAGVERLLSDKSKWIVQSVEFEFRNADRALGSLSGGIEDVLQEPEQRSKLAYARIVTSSLTDLIGMRLTAEIGMTAGFSSLDGD